MKTIKFFKYAALATVLITGLSACNDDDGVTPITTEYASLQDFYNANKKAPQVFTIDGATGGTVVGNEGTEITFPAGSLTDNGNPITGNVTIELTEFYKKSDLFYNNVPTESGTSWLVTGGSFFIEAKQNGANLDFGLGIDAFLPEQTEADGFENNMFEFGSQGTPGDATPANWFMAGDNPVAYSGTIPVGYTMENIGQFLRNCDAFYNVPGPKTQFSTSFPGVASVSDVTLWMFVEGQATAINITTNNGSTKDTYNNSIPVGVNATLLAFSTANGFLEYATQEITVSGNDSYSLNLQPKTQAELDTFLATIN